MLTNLLAAAALGTTALLSEDALGAMRKLGRNMVMSECDEKQQETNRDAWK